MLKAVIFDFDGVIVESAQIKTAAFQELFSAWPADQARAGVEYHLRNAGINRLVKFRYFFEKILGSAYSSARERDLAARFEAIVFEQVLRAPLVKGAGEFLEKYFGKYRFFIASGTPESELAVIVERKGLKRYFERVRGAPAVKPDILAQVLRDFGYQPEETVFIGDGESDLRAAGSVGVPFILRRTPENQVLGLTTEKTMADLTELERILHLAKEAQSC
ncbi:MAG: HAD family hydrolase [Candidatus Omnitrophica bacterium]|nr:HAD family hydrolase [Candidatus Omnitrophota bacterium]